jgi:hypothetical protein
MKLELPIVEPALASNGIIDIPIFWKRKISDTIEAAINETLRSFFQSEIARNVDVRTKKNMARCIQFIVPAMRSRVLQKLRSMFMPVKEVMIVTSRKETRDKDIAFHRGRNCLLDIASRTHAAKMISVNIQKNTVFGTTKGKKNAGCTTRGAASAIYAPQRTTSTKTKPKPLSRLWGLCSGAGV